MPSTSVHPTPPITFGAAEGSEATRMPTDIRFCRNNFTRNSVRHNDQCRKCRTDYCNCQWILFTRTVAPPPPQIEGVYGHGNTIRRTLDFSMHLINLLIAFNCVSRSFQIGNVRYKAARQHLQIPFWKPHSWPSRAGCSCMRVSETESNTLTDCTMRS